MRTASTSLFGVLPLALLSCATDYEIIAEPVDVDPADIAECGFTPIPFTDLSAYDCNPVFTGTGEQWGEQFQSIGFRAQEVLGHPFYQIWYSANPEGSQGGEWGLGYAVSGNGTDWETHTANPLVLTQPGSWDFTNMDAVQVEWDDSRSQYVLFYQGFNLQTNEWGLGIKTSPNGIDWVAHNDGNRVIDFAQERNGISYCWPLGVTYNAGSGYTGYLGGQPVDVPRSLCQIYSFQGTNLDDFSSFTFSENEVLRAGPEEYDAGGMASVSVVQYAENEWYMFYIGFAEWDYSQNGFISSLNHTVNMATSTDGVTWTKSPDNPLPINNTLDGLVSDVAVRKVGSRVLVWITDYYPDIEQSAVGFFTFEPGGSEGTGAETGGSTR